MYIFGGKDDENDKLNDTWKFNFNTFEWTYINAANPPLERSGHCSQIHNDNFMVIYGGIFEVTKELNDMHVFDLRKENWVSMFEEINSPKKFGEGGSPNKSLNFSNQMSVGKD
jgi:hypothetical protein